MGDRNPRETSLADWLRKLPHYLYVADLIAGKQVLEVGCGSGAGARFLADHGAARVVGIDTRAGKVEHARRRYSAANLSFRHEDPASMEFRDHGFDCVFVPDGAALIKRPAALRELRRVLAPDGYLILVAPSADRSPEADGLSFHEIRDGLEPLFDPVRMVAQMPLVAMSLVEYAEDDSGEVALDTSLVEWSRAPEGEVTDYMAVCGGRLDRARGFTIVQLPLRPGMDVVERSMDSGLQRALAAATGRVGNGTISAQIAGALHAHAELTRELERTLAEQQLYGDELREELEQTLERADATERERRALAEKLEVTQEELKAWRSRASVAEGEIMRLRLDRGEDPSAPAGEAQAASDELAGLRAALEQARGELAQERARREQAEADRDAPRARLDEQQARIEQLQQERDALAKQAAEAAPKARAKAPSRPRKKAAKKAAPAPAEPATLPGLEAEDRAAATPAAEDAGSEQPGEAAPAES